jgi:hypothetical protein
MKFLRDFLGTTPKDQITTIAGLCLLVSAILDALSRESDISLSSVARVLAAGAGALIGFATGKDGNLDGSDR